MQTIPHNEHGVFLCVFNLGLLITGKAGIGKSTLALELIERGHAFISDDVVAIEIKSDSKGTQQSQLVGKSPYILKNLLAVRDLGVLNIEQMFSTKRCLSEYTLDLIVELISDETTLNTTLNGIQSTKTILNHTVPYQQIHAHPKRNLAIIIETAVKKYILSKQQNDAVRLLKKRQQECMTKPL